MEDAVIVPEAVADSRRAPLVARVAGVGAPLLAATCFARFGLGAEAWVAAYFVSVLVVLSAIDFENRVLPNRIVLPSAALVLLARLVLGPSLEWPVAAAGAAFLLFLPVLLDPRSMGMGDVKLGLLLGAGLGREVVPGLVLAFLAVFPVALFLLARRGRSVRGATIPFGPFLALGGIAALFLSDGVGSG